MQAFRVPKNKPSRTPKLSERERRELVAAAISSFDSNLAMVACSECVAHGATCYYDREQSKKCAECLRRQRDCDGTFALEEYRKVGEHKKQLQSKSRLKRREIARLRKVLAEAEAEDANLQDSIADLDLKASRMLKREMLALGVLEAEPVDKEIALGDPGFPFEGLPQTESIDWEVVWTEPQPSGLADGAGTDSNPAVFVG